MKRSILLASVLICTLPFTAFAEGSRRANSRADAWLGRDAAELLMQLRVDGGKVEIEETDTETRYTWSSWTQPWSETVGRNPNQRMVGLIPGTNGGASTPVFQTEYEYYERVDHPAQLRCTYTFVADIDGIIRKWSYEGNQCGSEIKPPRNAK